MRSERASLVVCWGSGLGSFVGMTDVVAARGMGSGGCWLQLLVPAGPWS